MTFEKVRGPGADLTVKARLTMDASDWGDVIRLSGAKYGAGPDLRARFGEPSVMPKFTDVPAHDPQRPFIEAMLTWGQFGPQQATFQPEGAATWGMLHRWLGALGLPAAPGLRMRIAKLSP